mgnify:CR=1 FL=1
MRHQKFSHSSTKSRSDVVGASVVGDGVVVVGGGVVVVGGGVVVVGGGVVVAGAGAGTGLGTDGRRIGGNGKRILRRSLPQASPDEIIKDASIAIIIKAKITLAITLKGEENN